MREEFQSSRSKLYVYDRAQDACVLAELEAGGLLTGRSRQYEGVRAVLSVNGQALQVQSSLYGGKLDALAKLQKALDAKGFDLLCAGTHPEISISGLSEPDGGYIGRRAYLATDRVFPSAFPIIGEKTKGQVEKLFNAGQLDLASLPCLKDALDVPIVADRVRGMLLGLCIGDSLGNTSESMGPDARQRLFGEIRDYLPNDHANGARVGLPSDDTQLTFWTLASMLEKGRCCIQDLAVRYSSHRIWGIGRTMRSFLAGVKALEPGRAPWQARQHSAGNGALMRVAGALAPHLFTPTSYRQWDILFSSSLTHDDRSSTAACLAFAEIMLELMQAKAPPEPSFYWEKYVEVAKSLEGEAQLRSRVPGSAYTGPIWRLVDSELPKAFREGLSSKAAQERWYSGAFALETVPTALYILARHGENPEEAIIRAVNDSWDNDTVAAIVGAAVGALYGQKALPERWQKGLLGRLTVGDEGQVQRGIEQVCELEPSGRRW